MTSTEIKDFKIRATISFSYLPNYSNIKKTTFRKGLIKFDSKEKDFVVTFDNVKSNPYVISISSIKQPERERCPRGIMYMFKFDMPDLNFNECFLRAISEHDKQLIHSYIIKAVGVKKTLHKQVSTSGLNLTATTSTTNKTKQNISLSTLSPPRKRRSPPKPPPPSKKHRPEKVTTSLLDFNIVKKSEFDVKEEQRVVNDSFERDFVSPEPTTIVSKSPETPKIVVPPGEQQLPDDYTRDDFWTKLKDNQQVRTGVCGEWVKGKVEHLTMEGLLCLRDGEWLNADLIDAYLHQLCRRTPLNTFNNKENSPDKGYATDNIVQYIPTYGLLSYEKKKEIPTKWYWKMEGVEAVLAPVHLHNSHWAMSIAKIDKKEIILMDSMNNGFEGSDKRDFMETFLNILMQAANQFTLSIGTIKDWTLREILDVPQQLNGTDCGIFALLFARYEIEGRCLDFDQKHMCYFRRQICKDLISSIL